MNQQVTSVYQLECIDSTADISVISSERTRDRPKVVCDNRLLWRNSLLLGDAEIARHYTMADRPDEEIPIQEGTHTLDGDVLDRYGQLLSIEDQKDPRYRWTPKKRRFCYFMARIGSVKDSATRAGYTNPEYGAVLMMEPPVQLQVQHELRALLRAESENEESVVARWARWAQVDIGDYFDAGWNLNPVEKLSEDQRKCIKKVKISHNQFGRNVDLELHDAHKANNDLAMMMGVLGKIDEGKQPPEEAAKSIREMLREMNDVDGLQEPTLEVSTTEKSKVTH